MTWNTQSQYERFPYPPIPWVALPRRGEGKELRFELGTRLAFEAEHSHAGIRVLVAGAGTFETLVVAQQHPLAREIVAVDLSLASLRNLRRRIRFFKLCRPWTRLPPIRLVHCDLMQWDPGLRDFDYILASNLLQHVNDPGALLSRFASWLDREGILRAVTYPRASRIWMRETALYLQKCGLNPDTPSLKTRARKAIAKLSTNDPIRSCFESQSETQTQTGLIDAFFNACEKPLAPLQWKAAAESTGLELVADTQNETSRSDFLIRLFPETARLDRWSRLQILDDLLELCSNPILWFRKNDSIKRESHAALDAPLFPGEPKNELIGNLKRVSSWMGPLGIPPAQILEVLKREVGSRVTAPPEETPLPGLALSDYSDLFELSDFFEASEDRL